MKYTVLLDSRQSSGARPSSCKFFLNQQIVNARQVKILTFTFANTLYNVVSPSNTLVFDSVTVTLTEGFYDFAAFIGAINTALLASVPFVAQLGGNPNAVVLSATDEAEWTIGTNSLQSGGLLASFVLVAGSGPYTGDFTTDIFLAIPQAVALHSASLQGPDRFVVSYPTEISYPFGVFAVTEPFGEIMSVEQSNALQLSTTLSHSNLSTLDVVLRDATTYRELTEISHWFALLEMMV